MTFTEQDFAAPQQFTESDFADTGPFTEKDFEPSPQEDFMSRFASPQIMAQRDREERAREAYSEQFARPGTELTTAIAGDPLGFAMLPFTITGDVLNAAASDVGATLGTGLAGRLDLAGQQGGNLYEYFNKDREGPLPQERVLADISESNPALATTGKIAAGLVKSAPMLALMPQGALGKLVAAGFTADMLHSAGDAATRLGTEMGKPEGERDMGALTTALSDIIQAGAFAPLTGAHAGGKVIGERVAPRAEAIRELAKSLKSEPLDPTRGLAVPPALRELGIPQASLTAEPFLQPGIPSLADAALREAGQRIIDPRADAIGALRREIEPPQIEPVTIATAERLQGGGEAPYGKTSFMRGAEAPITEGAQNARPIPSPESVPQPEIRPRVGEEAPLRQQGETPGVQEGVRGREADAGGNAPPEVKLRPDPPVPESEFPPLPGATDSLITIERTPVTLDATITTKLAALKFKADKNGKVIPDDPGQVFSLPHPDAIKQIGKQLWNDSIDLALAAIKAGKSATEAINTALRHVRFNAQRFNEAKLRANLSSIIESEAKPKAATTGAPKQKITAPTLDDVYKIFDPEKKPGTPLKQRAINIAEGVRTGFSSKFRPVNKLAEDIAKAYGTTTPKDIAGIMEQLKGSQGKGEAQIYRFDQDVSKLVKGDERDFNAYMFLRRSVDRLTQDAADIAKAQAGGEVPQLNRRAVARYTLNELNPKLATLEAKLGPEKLAQFQQAAEGYQRYMDDALRLQVESGRMSPEVYAAIKEGNQFYAPFKVMKYLEEVSRPPGTGRRIDTTADFTKAMVGIEDPNFKLGDMLGAARQSILMSQILADKNMAMRHVAELSPFDTDGQFIRKLTPAAEVPQGWEAVNVLERGKQQRYAVRPAVAEAIQLYGVTGADIGTRLLSASSVPFRAGATAFNIPFQVSNLLADVPRQALVSKYGVRGASDLVRYPLDLVHSFYSSMMGDMVGVKNKLFLDFLDSGVAGSTVQEFLTPDALKFREPSTISKSRKLAGTVLNTIPGFAKAIEQTSKIVGVKRAMRFEGVESGAQLAKQIPEAITELRRFSGSPDFGRTGKAVEQYRLNLLYMFLNARIQGAVADVGRLTGRDGAKTAASTWFKVGTAVGLPTAYLYALNNSDEYKDDYAKRSKLEKDNYWLIPKDSFITTENGEKLRDYWRIPKRESAKWIANMTESALNFAKDRDPQALTRFGVKLLEDISPVNIQGDTAQQRLESIGSSLNPILKAPLELATSRDMYRHRELIPDSMQKASPEKQFTAVTPEAFKKLAELMPDVAPEFLRSPIILDNLTRNLTAGLITQFLPRKPVSGRSGIEQNPLMQRFQALPYSDNEEFKSTMKELERESVNESLDRHRAAMKLLEDNKGKSPSDIIGQSGTQDLKLMRHIVDLWVAKENGATAQDRQIIALPIRQRAAYIAQKLKGLTPEKQQEMIQELARKRIFTEAVAEALPEAMK